MTDLHERIERAITEREEAARAAEARARRSFGWQELFSPEVYRHLVLNDPAAVLRRCAADRRLLELHKPTGDERDYPAEHTRWYCPSCCDDRCDALDEHKAPGKIHCCESLDALAEGYGLT